MKIGIIGAFNEEIEKLVQIFHLEKEVEKEVYTGHVHDKMLVVANSGIGKVNSGAMTQYLIDQYQLDYIINSGCAGSLVEKVKLFDIVVSNSVTYHDFYPVRIRNMSMPDYGEVMADSYLMDSAERILKDQGQTYFVGMICSGDCFVTDAVMRDRIFSETKALAVDMESASIGHIARKNGVPFVAIRTISDFADGEDEFEVKAAHQSSQIVKKLIEKL